MRLIDADELEKEICAGCNNKNHKYENCIDCALANAPTVKPETLQNLTKPYNNFEGWIPCSERLPENRNVYLVTLARGIVTTELYDNGFDEDRTSGHHHPKNTVIAWMPLPSPYQPESEE